MSNNWFKFKRFTVEQSDCAMKVGTDGVLLGAWCRIAPTDKAILDIGTGTGLIALQLAQRTERWPDICNANLSCEHAAYSPNSPATASPPCLHDPHSSNTAAALSSDIPPTIIHAVEIDPAACRQAQRNFDASPWSDRLHLHSMPVQQLADDPLIFGQLPLSTPPRRPLADLQAPVGELTAGNETQSALFDHIVSNQPYFVAALTSPDPSRTAARHADSLSYEELISVCDRLLKPTGRISLILPVGSKPEALTGADKMIALAAARGFTISRLTEVHSTPKSGPKRTLIEFSRRLPPHSQPAISPARLTITGPSSGTFSEEYRTLTRDFYLYF